MRALRAWLMRFAGLFGKRRSDRELSEEIESNLELHVADNVRAGMSQVEARRQALIKLGGVESAKERYRERRGVPLIETTWYDLRFGLRQLRKSPGFALAAVLTLALSIGANAVVFSVMNAMVIRPLNLPDAESLYCLEHGSDNGFQSYPDYIDLRDRNSTFDSVAAFNVTEVGLYTGDRPARTWVYEVTGNYFDTLRVHPFLGRLLHASDEHGPDSAPYVVISYAYWHTHFGDDRGVVGRSVLLDKHPFTVVGVAPADFRGTIEFIAPDLYVPIVNQAQIDGDALLNKRGYRWIFDSVGHLKPGVTPAQATADLNSIGKYLEETYPKDDKGSMTFDIARPSLYGNYLGRPVTAFLTALMLLAGLILLAACANLGSMFSARAADRAREIAMRLALGASRGRILRQLFTEALLISVVGGALGLWGSMFLLGGMSAWQPFSRFPLQMSVNPDWHVYVMALLLALASGFLFGAVPVRQVMDTDPYAVVKSGSTAKPGRRITLRDVLLVGQIAICAVLVTSSLVAVRGMTRSLHGDFGFNPENAIVLDSNLNDAGYNAESGPAMQKRIIEAVKGIPGVTSAGMVDNLPLGGGGNFLAVFKDDVVNLTPANAAANAYIFCISPDYLDAAGTRLLTGRAFTWSDDKNAPRVAIVNREFARRLFGSVENATGKYFKSWDGVREQVVGVVVDGKYMSLPENMTPAAYQPILQAPSNSTSLVVRTAERPELLAGTVTNKVRAVDPGLPFTVQTWEKGLDGALFPARIATIALGVLGVMGAMLSVTGIFGVAAYSVSKRKRELGIRMALGARRKEVLDAALGHSFRLLAFGSAAGLLLGLLASRVLAVIVFQATPRDPIVLAGVVFAMFLLGLLAAWVPAQRALSLDPLILLREE